MTKKEFIEKFKLIKTKTKCRFEDGRVYKERTLYKNEYGDLYVFYDNDLCGIKPYTYKHPNGYEDGMEYLNGYLCGCYSWYH